VLADRRGRELDRDRRPRSTVLSVYDSAGRDLGTRRLDRLVGPRSLSTIGGAGRWLAVGVETSVRTFEVREDATCGRRADR
jgi:hypothetical protein